MIAGFDGPAAIVLLPASGDASFTGGVCADARGQFGEAATPRMATTVAASASGTRGDVIDPPRSGNNCMRSPRARLCSSGEALEYRTAAMRDSAGRAFDRVDP